MSGKRHDWTPGEQTLLRHAWKGRTTDVTARAFDTGFGLLIGTGWRTVQRQRFTLTLLARTVVRGARTS